MAKVCDFSAIFDDPDEVRRAEYRAIHDACLEMLYSESDLDPELTRTEVSRVIATLDEFEGWARMLKAKAQRLLEKKLAKARGA